MEPSLEQFENDLRKSFLTIVIPAHNEEHRIGPTLETYALFFKEIVRRKEIRGFEILVVLNACRDHTFDVVKGYAKKYREIRWLSFLQGGKGFAIMEGFKDARGDLVGFIDADMSTQPDAYYDLVTHICTYDGAIASRWLKDSIITVKQPLSRIVTSRIFNFLVRGLLLMPYRDTQCGCKIFRKRALDAVVPTLEITRWAFDIDLLYKFRKKGFSILEHPTLWDDKGESKLQTVKVSFQMFSALLRLRLLYSPLRFMILLYDRLPEGIKFHHYVG